MVDAQEAARVLSEIAYLLRLEEKDAFRARAFTSAAGALLATRPDLAALRKTNSIESIEGVGSGIARVLGELVDTGRSSYLERLQQERGAALPEGAITLSGYRGDIHAHSTWSDGRASILEMAQAAAGLGYEYVGITDHSPRITVVHGLDGTRLAEQRREIEAVQAAVPDVEILQGIEVDILEDGALDLPDDVLARLDLVIASPHVKLRMEPAPMTERMLRAVENPHVDVVGHPTGRRPGSRPGAVYDFEKVFRRAAEHGVVMEIDCDPARMDLSPEMARMAADLGCMISLDSDAHAPGEFLYVELGGWMAARAGLREDQLLNWLPVERLRAHLAARG